MSRRRRNSSSIEPDSPPPRKKVLDEQNVKEYPSGHQRPQVDSVTGQAGAFPGLDDDNDALFYGPALDGIDYLRMVRSERKGIPELLTSKPLRQELDEEDGGCYFDGAYTAQNEENVETSPRFHKSQELYYESLLAHFRLIRATMRCIPPIEIIQSLGESRPISFPAQSKQAKEIWQTQLLQQDPHPAQIACMDADSILHLVQLLTRKMTQFFKSSQTGDVGRIGAWIWAIMGKCPERGELGSEEISILRAFARRAAEISSWLEHKEIELAEDQDSDDEFEHGSFVPEAMSKCLEPEALGNQESKCVILDAIITIVGEHYGQRDLLELRKAWPVE